MINVCGLWKNTSKDGKEYLSGNIGDAKILIFPNDKRGNDKAPDYRLVLAEKSKNQPNKSDSKPDDDLFELAGAVTQTGRKLRLVYGNG